MHPMPVEQRRLWPHEPDHCAWCKEFGVPKTVLPSGKSYCCDCCDYHK